MLFTFQTTLGDGPVDEAESEIAPDDVKQLKTVLRVATGTAVGDPVF